MTTALRGLFATRRKDLERSRRRSQRRAAVGGLFATGRKDLETERRDLPARVPCMLALAHRLQRAIQRGDYTDRVELACQCLRSASLRAPRPSPTALIRMLP